MLGTRSPSDWAPPEAHPAEEVHSVPLGVAGADGAVTLSLTRLFFPPVCCACGQATNQWMEFEARRRWSWLISCLTGGHAHLDSAEIPIPMCASCQEHYRSAARRGGWLGLFAGLLLAAPLGVLALMPMNLDHVLIAMLGIGSVSLCGWLTGADLAKWRRSPVRSAHYSARQGTVRLRFRRPHYAELVAESVRAMTQKN